MANKCLGLYELYDGINRNHIVFDNGNVHIFDGDIIPIQISTSDNLTFGNEDQDLYSVIQVGTYMMFADNGNNTPYKWTNGDTTLTKLIASGTEYVFKYLESFQRRVVGAYTTETNGDISIRWSTAWPTTAISALNFPAANQLYVPNDDPIRGLRTMRADQCFVYSSSSIHQLVYFPDYETPFQFFTVVPQQGAENNAGIVNLGDRHYFFNRNYGFCEYRGGSEFPYGGRPISEDIETDLQDMYATYYNRIVGTFFPLTREVVWAVCFTQSSKPSHLLYYNIDTKQWRVEDRFMRFVDNWIINLDYTWNDLVASITGAATWENVGDGSQTWGAFPAEKSRLVYMEDTGRVFYHDGDDLDGDDIDGYRIEPILDFGDPSRYDKLLEIWYDMVTTGNFNLHTWHRGGDTSGEVEAASWTALDDLSHNSPEKPCVHCDKSNRLHQIKWGTDSIDERFQVSKIIFRFEPQGVF